MKFATCGAVATVLLFAGAAGANEFETELTDLANGRIAELVQSSQIIDAIKNQNSNTAGFDQSKIDELDQTWRAETDAADQPMIDDVLSREVSIFLADAQDGSDGLFTEIFVMDAKGLNVGQSDVTSDYWQGDEAKWQKTFKVGADAIHVGELEEDESTQTLQSQVSVSVADPESGEVIGAVTFGVNVDNI
ncbi:MAG: hypothetical protein ABJN26_26985 [Stappiaceae bacterium]